MGGSKMNSKRVYTNTGYLMKQEIFQINHLTYHLKELEKEEQENTKVGRRKEIIKVGRRKEIIKIKEKIKQRQENDIEQINETKNWFFEKIKKIDKPLPKLI